ncbi:hypothetical protein OG713_04795 [Streptomyces sp. NBC_00723]|uniref:hypothetical protein n=1 Tax=Streptomyces sp. NBC_00723 TaxID=2903673 RepID=UPI003863F646
MAALLARFGAEVTDDVLSSPVSIVFDLAESRPHTPSRPGPGNVDRDLVQRVREQFREHGVRAV